MLNFSLLAVTVVPLMLSLTSSESQAQVPPAEYHFRLLANYDRVYVRAEVSKYEDRRVLENRSVGGSLFSAALNESNLRSRVRGDLRSAGIKVVDTYDQSKGGSTLILDASVEYSYNYNHDYKIGMYGWKASIIVRVLINTDSNPVAARLLHYEWMGVEDDEYDMRREAYRWIRGNCLEGFIRDWRKYH